MLYRNYTKGASHSQWPKIRWVNSPPSTFQLKIFAVRNKSFFCSKPISMVIPSLSSYVTSLLLTAPSTPTTTGITSTRLKAHNFLISLFRSWYSSIFLLSIRYMKHYHYYQNYYNYYFLLFYFLKLALLYQLVIWYIFCKYFLDILLSVLSRVKIILNNTILFNDYNFLLHHK